MTVRILIYVFAGLILAACSSNGSAETDDTVAALTSVSITGGMAIDLMTKQTGAEPEQITILSEEKVDFSDSSLGCPKPGMAYMQVITPGHKVLLKYAGKIYDVRIAGGRGFICENPAESGATR